jgi:hypothetical protein
MKKIFTIENGVGVPDGTIVYPFLNPWDTTSGLPWNLLQDFSLAMGKIGPHQCSKIHVMPLVTQVTFVLQGRLGVKMKDPDHPHPYSLQLEVEQAILTRPGTFLQFCNNTHVPCRVLYFVSPAYVFLSEEGRVTYDDSLVLDEDWKGLKRIDWKPRGLRSLNSIRKARQVAKERFADQAALKK